MKRISVVGLGKLGLPLLVSMASRGYQVIGYDHDESKMALYTQGRFHYEPGLEKFMKKYASRIQFTHHLEDIADTFMTFVVVPTPSTKEGAFSLRYLDAAVRRIGRVLAHKKAFHIVNIVSTVLPGNMQQLQGALEKASKKRCGRNIGLCYNPAFIALGNVIHGFLRPDFVLIGESDKRTGDRLESFYLNFCRNEARINRMNFVNAELTKIAVNTFVTMKISFGNTLARLCEQFPGAHSEIVTQAIGSDKRIGTSYLKGALGYGGPCFPRDNKAFAYVAKKAGWRAFSAEATDKINNLQVQWLARFIFSEAGPKDKIAILGLSYKPDTDVIEESQGMGLAKLLLNKKRRLIVYDPASMEEARKVLKNRVTFAENLSQCLRLADVIVITTPWDMFKKFKPADLMSTNGYPKKIIDPWRILEPDSCRRCVEYIPLGVSLKARLESS